MVGGWCSGACGARGCGTAVMVRVGSSSGEVWLFEGDSFRVDSDGDLLVTRGSDLCAVVRDQHWVYVQEVADVVEVQDRVKVRWRRGSRNPFTVYEQRGEEPDRRSFPDGDRPVGFFLDQDAAELAVRAVNNL